MNTHKVAEKQVSYTAVSAHTHEGQSPATAKIFMNGRSQAVRLPKAFRFDTDEVLIERQGDAVVLRPKIPTDTWWAEVLEILQSFEGIDFIERERLPLADASDNILSFDEPLDVKRG